MTTLSNGRLDSFKNRVWSTGLDRDRCRIVREPGVFKVDAAASFREGQPVALNSSGLVVAATNSTGVLGVAKANCMQLGRAVINETLTFTAAGQTRNLRRAAVTAAGLTAKVAGVGRTVATAAAATVDFVVNYANGTLQHDSTNSTISPAPSASTPVSVEVQYVIELTASDYEFEGRNFFNQLNDVVTQDNMVTVIQAPAVIFTTEYVNPLGTAAGGSVPADVPWAVNSPVYVSSGGLFVSNLDPAVGVIVGRCVSPPTAGDPWLGIELFGSR